MSLYYKHIPLTNIHMIELSCQVHFFFFLLMSFPYHGSLKRIGKQHFQCGSRVSNDQPGNSSASYVSAVPTGGDCYRRERDDQATFGDSFGPSETSFGASSQHEKVVLVLGSSDEKYSSFSSLGSPGRS